MIQRSPGKEKYTSETGVKIPTHVAIVYVKISPENWENETASCSVEGELVSHDNNTVDCKL